MSDLTKEHFDQQITRVLDTMALKVDVNERFESIDKTLDRFVSAVADRLNLDVSSLFN